MDVRRLRTGGARLYHYLCKTISVITFKKKNKKNWHVHQGCSELFSLTILATFFYCAKKGVAMHVYVLVHHKNHTTNY